MFSKMSFTEIDIVVGGCLLIAACKTLSRDIYLVRYAGDKVLECCCCNGLERKCKCIDQLTSWYDTVRMMVLPLAS